MNKSVEAVLYNNVDNADLSNDVGFTNNKFILNKKKQAIKVTKDFVKVECKNTTTKALERYKVHHK